MFRLYHLTFSLTLIGAIGGHCALIDPDCFSHDISCRAEALYLYSVPALAGTSASAATSATAITRACSIVTNTAPTFFTFHGAAGATTEARDVCATSDGGLIWAGTTTGNIATLGGRTPVNAYAGNIDALMVKIDSDGAVQWYTMLGAAAGDDKAHRVVETPDGGYLIAGEVTANIPTLSGLTPLYAHAGGGDGLLVKLGSAGALEWYGFFGSASTDRLHALRSAPDGSLVAAGSVQANIATLGGRTPLNAFSGAEDLFIVNISQTGSILWYSLLGGAGSEDMFLRGDVAVGAGGICLVGPSSAGAANIAGRTPVLVGGGGNDLLTLKLNLQGGLDWYTYAGSAGGVEFAQGVAAAADGGCVTAGFSSQALANLGGQPVGVAYAGGDDGLVIRYNSDGTVRWFNFAGSVGGTDELRGVVEAADGSIYTVGSAAADVATMSGKTPRRAYSGNFEGMLIGYTAAGAVDSYTFIGGGFLEELRSVALTPAGQLVIAGYSQGTLGPLNGKSALLAYPGAQSALILRTDLLGDL